MIASIGKNILFGLTIFLLLLFSPVAEAATSVSSVEVASFPVPTNLSTTAIGSSRINLNWDLVAGAVSYKIYRGGIFIGSASANFYNDTGLFPGTTYTYTVSAVNSFGGESFQCTPVSTTTLSLDGDDGGGSMVFFYRPIITSNGGKRKAYVEVKENQTVVTTVQAKTSRNSDLKYKLSGGSDEHLFQIDEKTGELKFLASPNFEEPLDKDLNNVYEVVVTAVNEGYYSKPHDLQYIYIAVTDVEEGEEVQQPQDEEVQEPQNKKDIQEKPSEESKDVPEAKAEVCSTYLTEDIKFGRRKNSPDAVRKLKEFLNEYEGENLDVNNSTYDQAAFDAVIRFQEKYAETILSPWGLTRGTGYVYHTTIRQINIIVCATPVIENGCDQYLTQFIHSGGNNDPEEVKKLQIFLWHYEGFTEVEVSGNFDWNTYLAVVAFQERYADEILQPWGMSKGSGWVYITTLKKINELYCQKAGIKN